MKRLNEIQEEGGYAREEKESQEEDDATSTVVPDDDDLMLAIETTTKKVDIAKRKYFGTETWDLSFGTCLCNAVRRNTPAFQAWEDQAYWRRISLQPLSDETEADLEQARSRARRREANRWHQENHSWTRWQSDYQQDMRATVAAHHHEPDSWEARVDTTR